MDRIKNSPQPIQEQAQQICRGDAVDLHLGEAQDIPPGPGEGGLGNKHAISDQGHVQAE